MSLLVVGSVALDSVETPRTRARTCLGGSAVVFLLCRQLLHHRAAGRRGRRRLAGGAHRACCSRGRIDTAGLQVVPGGKTFRWRGKYQPNMNDRETLDVQLNVLRRISIRCCPTTISRCKFVFLANGSPQVQLHVARPDGRARGWSWPTRWTCGSAQTRRACCSCSGGSTAWCSTTARPSC